MACCREYIKGLPATEAPEVFGMHENANIAFELHETRRIMSTILAIQPRLAPAPGATTPEQQAASLATNILDNLPPLLDISEAAPGVLEGGVRSQQGQNSLAVVLAQEVGRFNRLSEVVRGSLEELVKALQGVVIMSQELELLSTSLLNSQASPCIPSYCMKPPCIKPSCMNSYQ